MMSCSEKVVNRLDSCKYYILSAVVCVTGPDTIIASKDYLGVWGKGNPPCNSEDNLHAGLLVNESQFQGLLRESWTKGSSGVRPVIHGPD